MSDKMTCWKCEGLGVVKENIQIKKCNICEGSGEVDDPFHDEGVNYDTTDPFEGEKDHAKLMTRFKSLGEIMGKGENKNDNN